MPYLSTKQGAGGFLNPPTHPEHTMSVQGKDISASLSYGAEHMDSPLREQCQFILNNWVPLPLEDPAVQVWIRRVLGYFRNCYKGLGDDETAWYCDKLRIADINPTLNVDLHAGVHLIRKYYPHFVPTEFDFFEAKWGD